jgi:DNA repair protein RadD
MSKSIHFHLKGKISINHVQYILGETIYNGISNYNKTFNQESSATPEEILIDGLGYAIVFDKLFQEKFIKQIASASIIDDLCIELNVENANDFNTRSKILKKNYKKIGDSLIKILDLESSLYNPIIEAYETVIEQKIITPNPSMFSSLHDYQKLIKDEIIYNLLNKTKSKMLVHMPTGSGKTKTTMEAVTDFIRTKIPDDGYVLWFAHSAELCSQAYDCLVEIWTAKGDYPLPIYKLFNDNLYDEEILNQQRAVIFIGFQKFESLMKSDKKKLQLFRSNIALQAKLIVIDEAHKALAKTYKKALDFVGSQIDCHLIGLTATPGRSNNINDPNNKILAEVFDDNLISVRDNKKMKIKNVLSYLQGENVLANINHKPIEVNIQDFDSEQIQRIIIDGELNERDINKLAESPYRNRIIIDEVENSLADTKKDLILIFACSTGHCILLKKLLEMRNIKSEIILSNTVPHERTKRIADFKTEKLKVLINFGVLTTGFDAPKLKTLIIARHTNSMILYSQMIGRALRGPRNGGNATNYIIDLIDNISNLGKADFMFSYWEEFWSKKLNHNK